MLPPRVRPSVLLCLAASRVLCPSLSATLPSCATLRVLTTALQIVEIEGDDQVWQIDMNRTYSLGSQEWYLQQRRKDKEDSGEIKVIIADRSAELDAMEVCFAHMHRTAASA